MEKVQNVVVAGVLTNKNKFLVVKRSSKEDILPNKWELPSGKVEFEEKPNLALKREIKEETGIEIQNYIPLKITDYTFGNEKKMKHTIQIIFLIKTEDMNVKLSSEHDDYKWILPEDLSSLDTFEDMKDILETAQNILKN